mgnify:CR=1 FL=1
MSWDEWAKANDVAVVIEGSHSCMTARGIKKVNSRTITTSFHGKFEDDIQLQNRLLMLIKEGN